VKRLLRFDRVPSSWLVALVCIWLTLVGVRSEASALAPPAAVKNLAAWYDASDNTTLTTASVVTQWNDKSGNGNTLTDTTGQPPLLGTAALNGLNVINFATTGQELATAGNFGVSGNVDRTLITVQYNGIINTGTDVTSEAFGFDFHGFSPRATMI